METLENGVREAIGPEYGFDIHHMDAHYRYFRDLRKQYPVLIDGYYLPLHVGLSEDYDRCRFCQ